MTPFVSQAVEIVDTASKGCERAQACNQTQRNVEEDPSFECGPLEKGKTVPRQALISPSKKRRASTVLRQLRRESNEYGSFAGCT